MSDLSKRALEIAIGQIGKEEVPRGSNWGRPVQDYLSSVGIHIQASWCMAFVYYCVDQAANQLGLPNPLFRTGGVLVQWNNRPMLQRDALYLPSEGDVIIFDHGHGLGHTGLVERYDSAGTIFTIEGNTNDTGAREGYEVIRKERTKTGQLKGYLVY